jgi:hypothetical protein
VSGAGHPLPLVAHALLRLGETRFFCLQLAPWTRALFICTRKPSASMPAAAVVDGLPAPPAPAPAAWPQRGTRRRDASADGHHDGTNNAAAAAAPPPRYVYAFEDGEEEQDAASDGGCEAADAAPARERRDARSAWALAAATGVGTAAVAFAVNLARRCAPANVCVR